MTRRQRAFVSGVTATAALGAVLVYAWSYVAPFILALFLAALIDRPVTFLCTRFGVGRGPAVVAVLIVALSALGAVVFLFAANLSTELEQLLDELPGYASRGKAFVDGLMVRAELLFSRLSPALGDVLRIHPEQWTAAVHSAAKGVLGTLRALPGALFVLFIGGLATYIISKDRHILWRGLLRTMPPEWRRPVIRLRDEIVGGALGIVRIQLLLVGITAVASIIGLAFVRVPYAWALGLLAGVLDLAPFLGPSTVFLPAATIYLLQGQLGVGLALLVFWMIIVTGRQLMEPHLFGAGLGLHPLTTLLALYIGVRVVGAAGFVAGPFVLIVVKALFVVTIAEGGMRR